MTEHVAIENIQRVFTQGARDLHVLRGASLAWRRARSWPWLARPVPANPAYCTLSVCWKSPMVAPYRCAVS